MTFSISKKVKILEFLAIWDLAVYRFKILNADVVEIMVNLFHFLHFTTILFKIYFDVLVKFTSKRNFILHAYERK